MIFLRRIVTLLAALAVVVASGAAVSQQSVTSIPGTLATSSVRRAVTYVAQQPYTIRAGNNDAIAVHVLPATINLPYKDFVAAGDTYEVFDALGSAATNNVTIQGNGATINGLSSYTVNINYGDVRFVYNGTEWNAFTDSASFTPAGAASGDLAGTYPAPTVATLTGAAGAVNVLGTATLSYGTAPASVGSHLRWRAPPTLDGATTDWEIVRRNGANTNDVFLLGATSDGAAAEKIFIGSTSGTSNTLVKISSAAEFQVKTDVGTTAGNPAIDVTTSTMTLGSAVAAGMPLAFGSAPATAGQVQLPNNGTVQARNAANNGNLRGLWIDGSNNVVLADETDTNTFLRGAGISLQSGAGPTTAVTIDGSQNVTLANLAGTGTRNATTSSTGLLGAGPETVLTGTVQTTNATTTSVITINLAASTDYQFEGRCVGAQTNGTAYSSHHNEANFRRNSTGAATQVGTTTSISSIASSTQAINWTAASNAAALQVTGIAATTINWTCYVTYQLQAGQ